MSTSYRGQTIHETYKGAKQAGMWQIYCKGKGGWVAAGDPMTQSAAVSCVEQMRSEGLNNEPHCVPL